MSDLVTITTRDGSRIVLPTYAVPAHVAHLYGSPRRQHRAAAPVVHRPLPSPFIDRVPWWRRMRRRK